jgi:uncharacterized membrane protein SpoIIM required for sporulation
MNFGNALRAVVAVFRTRPDELLPVYFLSPAIVQMTRVVSFLGVGLAYAYLATTGRLARFRVELRAADRKPPGPGASIEAYRQWFDQAAPAFEVLFPAEVLAALVATALASVTVFVVLYAAATAAQLSCCRGTLDDESGTEAAIAGAGRHWRTMLGLVLLQVLAFVVVTALAAAPVVVVAVASPAAAVLVGLVVGLVWLAALAALRVLFVFAAVAAVVDDEGVRDALGGAAGFVRANVGATLAYVAVAVGVLGAVNAVSALLGPGNGPVAALLGVVLVSPLLDLLKTALYGDHAGGVSPPSPPAATVTEQLRAGIRRGLRTTRGFVAARPGLNALAAALVVAGFAAGGTLAAPYEGLATASVDARLQDHSPPTAAATFATNNLSVAVGSALSGLALGVPAGVSLLFNGALLGVLGRLEAVPAELLAFVVPHGVVEIPALVVAGALGLSLGATGWRAARGRIGRRALADSLEEAFWVLVGVAALLAVAGLVEGFVSPYYYYRPFLAT